MTQEIWFELVGEPDDEIARSSEHLLAELTELDLESVERAPGVAAPAATRGVDPDAVATLVAVATSPLVLRASLDVARSWLERRVRGTVRVRVGDDEIELTAASAREQRELVRAFVDRNTM